MTHKSEAPQLIKDSVSKLRDYIEANDYCGYDPYDALKSKLLSRKGKYSSSITGFLLQQFIKRFPLNLRPLLFIPKGHNPVTMGLCIRAYTDLALAGIIDEEEAKGLIKALIIRLEAMIPEGYHGSCWGYDFPWQSRYFSVQAFQPSVVATGIIIHGIYEYFKWSGDRQAAEHCKSAAAFVMKDLNRIDETDDSLCFSYTPFDRYAVYNANMKAVRLLAQAHSLQPSELMIDTADKAMRYTMEAQNSDGSWYYASGSKGRWIDSYHTGYVLECGHAFETLSGNREWHETINKGYTFFHEHFIAEDGGPKFFHNRDFPIDCTSASQIILTLAQFGNKEEATQVALFMIREMQSKTGNFYFRKYHSFTRREAFMRWSDAWMFAGLSRLIYVLSKAENI